MACTLLGVAFTHTSSYRDVHTASCVTLYLLVGLNGLIIVFLVPFVDGVFIFAVSFFPKCVSL